MIKTILNHTKLLSVFGFVLAVYLFGNVPSSFSQDSNRLDWAYPARIPQHDNDSSPPALVADQNNTVHSFTTDVSNGRVIAYRQWTENVGWSVPVDIILPPRGGNAVIYGAEIDENDNLHLVIYYGTEVDASVFHYQAPILYARSANAWSAPHLITDEGGPIPHGHFVSDGADNLHVVYNGSSDGLGLYEVASTDGGETWATPSIIYLSSGNELLPAAVDAHIDEVGNIHAVWSIWSAELGAGVQLFYSQRLKGSDRWSRPFLIADRNEQDYESDWGSVISVDDELIVLYQDSLPATKYVRKSRDNGKTWTDPEQPWPHQGEYENAVFLKDSAGRLHVILGNRTGDCCHGMWHGRYVNGTWQNLEPVITGPKTIDFDPSKPSAVMSQGNLIFASWWMDTSIRNGVFYSYAYLDDVESFPREEIADPQAEAELEVADTESEAPIEAETVEGPKLPDELRGSAEDTSPASAITIGILISILGLLLIMAFWFFYNRLR